jgi:hypothetical protein
MGEKLMDERQEMISFYAHEAEMARMERHAKRLWILCIIMFLALVVTNAGWIWYESQWEDVTTTETWESDADDGGVAISNGSGRVNYGTSKVHEND